MKLDLTPFIGQPYGKFSISPVGKWLGGTLLEARTDGLSIEFEVREEMCNPFQVLHGGIITTMMDEVIGVSLGLCADYDTWFTSVNISVDFLASGKLGDRVIASAHIIRTGKNIAHIEARLLRVNDQKLIAKATSNMANTFRGMSF